MAREKDAPSYFVKCPGASQNFDQDALYLIPYNVTQIQPGVIPVYGNTFGETVELNQATQPLGEMLKDYILINIEENSRSQKFLVFARKVLPSSTLPPSNAYYTRKMASWPTVLRGQPEVKHNINAGNYTGTTIFENSVPETHELCSVLIEEWYTTDPWPDDLLSTTLVLPGWVKSPAYPLPDHFSLFCLHGYVWFPGLTGVTQINGQSINPAKAVKQSVVYPATEPVTWLPRYDEDAQVEEDGRYHRTRETVFPPFDPLTYPPPPLYGV